MAGFDQAGGAQQPPAPGAAEAAWLRYLRPFPVVRVKGRLVARGAKVTLLRVRAPARAKVDVRCARRECRVHKRFSGSRRIRRLERVLPAGTRITVRIWRTAQIGKYDRLRIRAGSPPRRDARLRPGAGDRARRLVFAQRGDHAAHRDASLGERHHHIGDDAALLALG